MCTCEGLKTDVLLSLFPQLNAKQTLSKFRCKICHTPSNASGKIRGKRKGVVTCAVRKRRGYNFWGGRHKLEKAANFNSEMKILTKNLLEKLNLAFWILLLLFFIFFINHQVISQVRNWGYEPYLLLKKKNWFQVKSDLGHKWDEEHRHAALNVSNVSHTWKMFLKYSTHQQNTNYLSLKQLKLFAQGTIKKKSVSFVYSSPQIHWYPLFQYLVQIPFT